MVYKKGYQEQRETKLGSHHLLGAREGDHFTIEKKKLILEEVSTKNAKISISNLLGFKHFLRKYIPILL